MRILIVGMTESVHLAKWLSLIDLSRNSVLVFPSLAYTVHPSIDRGKVKVLLPFYLAGWRGRIFDTRLGRRILRKLRLIRNVKDLSTRCRDLARAIQKYSPDLIHSMETQSAGYLLLETKERHFAGKDFPCWMHTNWGSDIFLFARLHEHEDRIRRLLKECDYYSCESRRDVDLAGKYGFAGKAFEPFPNAGGFNAEVLSRSYNVSPPSTRKLIMVKGYQGWAGRSLVALRALARARDKVKGFSVVVYSASANNDVKTAAELLQYETGIDVTVLDSHVSQDEMLGYFSKARIYIGLSISDGISTSMLEAMAMGAFPIQSNTSTADEWIEDSVTGYIVPPEDSDVVATRIESALTDDLLVDEAAQRNRRTIAERADARSIGKTINDNYDHIWANIAPRQG